MCAPRFVSLRPGPCLCPRASGPACVPERWPPPRAPAGRGSASDRPLPGQLEGGAAGLPGPPAPVECGSCRCSRQNALVAARRFARNRAGGISGVRKSPPCLARRPFSRGARSSVGSPRGPNARAARGTGCHAGPPYAVGRASAVLTDLRGVCRVGMPPGHRGARRFLGRGRGGSQQAGPAAQLPGGERAAPREGPQLVGDPLVPGCRGSGRGSPLHIHALPFEGPGDASPQKRSSRGHPAIALSPHFPDRPPD